MIQDFIIQEDGDVLRITLNRPDSGNALARAGGRFLRGPRIWAPAYGSA